MKMKKKKSKNSIAPGPWTIIKTKVKVRAKLKFNRSLSSRLGRYSGVYRSADGWKERGTYPILFNITATNLAKLMSRYDFNEVVSACERALNEIKGSNGRSLYGRIIILEILADHSKNPRRQFISCMGKTDKEYIKDFVAVRDGVLKKK
jgi:hypothetical protein